MANNYDKYINNAMIITAMALVIRVMMINIMIIETITIMYFELE